ncbi:MAG: hypothetical protein AVDCRST_MAG32-2326 [uncultured Nocardioides sp.]|uniref:Uncharacterized protein n=1 Tax=uncultured Nocardioides sp. TaxID=198441 RepID=A0A6J4NLV5_9ACTN|nr:MAG: hypothetical protein AVDCRST_MAG32-2326 [uncultured Nocardioides sp.]
MTWVAPPALRSPARLTCWRTIPHHGISTCGHDVHAVRLLDMVTAATSAHLVVRRHVDLMRTRSMICWHR